MQISKKLIRPLITEKTVKQAEAGVYTFYVDPTASKGRIAEELKTVYGVDVITVNTSILPRKSKRVLRTRLFTRTPKYKKAVVKLKEGQKLDFVPSE